MLREFFLEDGQGSMSRFLAFIAAITFVVAIGGALYHGEWDAAFNFGSLLGTLAGLGYGVARASAAYENARVAPRDTEYDS